ncbi:CMRF35-like molecule 6 [Rhinatrema bivittatum]|uniref:CMRF35-like molecule 6 n=1 Tax=Rhinatrema bivittatum TaxID=194408 RepID=UPI00112CC8C3|nr:CMRF35-like molecule 6 [Rhinatrema bivittatum]
MRLFPVWILMLLPGCWGLLDLLNNLLGLSDPVIGYAGGSLSVSCSYDKSHQGSEKCWCKEGEKKCSAKSEQLPGHVSIRDSPKEQTFTVTMDRLRMEDAGRYSCAVMQKKKCHVISKITVTVLPALPPLHPTTASPAVQTANPFGFTESSTWEEETSAISTCSNTPTDITKTSLPSISATSILQFLIPAILFLLFLVVLATVILIRAQRKRKQALVKEVASGYENVAFSHSPCRKVMPTTVYVTAGLPTSAESEAPCGGSERPPKPEPYYEEIQEPRWAARGRADASFYSMAGYPVQVQP